MQIIDLATEQTAAVTDILLAILAAYVAISLHQYRRVDSFKVSIWTWTLSLVTLAAVLGTLVHGLEMQAGLRRLIWHPLNLCLGLSIGLFCVGALHDLRGRNISQRTLLPLGFMGVLFYVLTTVMGGDFIFFVIYEVAMMCAALIIYIRLLAKNYPGAKMMASAVLVNIFAVGLQTQRVEVTLVWPFDHNGIFHLTQLAGLALLMSGLRSSLNAPEDRGNTANH